MEIKLIKSPPVKDGYYLVKFSNSGGLHLVLLQTDFDGRKRIVSDICPFADKDNKTLKCMTRGVELYFNEFPLDVWWSEQITTV
jgi:hypothetical protein